MATTLPTGDTSRSRLGMWALALVLGAILVYVVYSYIGTFVLGLFVYYITRPIHRRIAKRVPTSTLAAAVSLTVLALPLLLLLGYTIYVGAFQLAAFAESQDLTAISAALQPFVENLGGTGTSGDQVPTLSALLENPQAVIDQASSLGASSVVGGVATSAAGVLGVVGNSLIQLFIVLALAFYLLRDDHRLAGWFRDELVGEGTPVHYYFATVDRDLKTIFFGNILNAFAVAILGSISYVALNLVAPPEVVIPSPVLVGLLVGVGSLVPVVGMKIVYVPVALLLAVEAVLIAPALLWFPLVFAAVSLLIVDTIPDLVLRPYVSGRDMHTGAVMIAYIVGPLLFGWYGLFLGPLLLVAMVHFARIVLPELAHGTPLTARASTDNPLDPSDRADPKPEPEPVDPRTEANEGGTETEPDDRGDEENGTERAPRRQGSRRSADEPPPPTDRSTVDGSDSSADRVRSTWEEGSGSSTTDGGQPQSEGSSHRSDRSDERD